MGSASRSALIVATSIGAVEALKDQFGFCRWNFVLRSIQQQYAKTDYLRSFSQANKISAQFSSSSYVVALSKMRDNHENLGQSEESLKKVMYLSCWGS